jgi:cps6D
MKAIKNSLNYLFAPASYRKGLKEYSAKQWQQALASFQTSVKQSPEHPQSHFKLGLCYMKLGNLEEAHQHIGYAIRQAPYNVSWKTQMEQCEKKLHNIGAHASHPITSASSAPAPLAPLPRISQDGSSNTLNVRLKKKLLLIPSDYNHRVMADIMPFIEHYKYDFDIYIILRECDADIERRLNYTIVKNGTPYGEFLKFTADYVIDAGTMNAGYRITDTNKWISVWHGIPYKKMFVDLDIKHLSGAIRYGLAYDCMISMSDFYTNTFLKGAMRYDGIIHQVGCAKMDNLLNNKYSVQSVRKRFNLPDDRQIALYAPASRCYMSKENLPFDVEKLACLLGEKWLLLVRTPSRSAELPEDTENIRFISNLDMNEIENFLVADILISDYHPIIHLFNEYQKPVVLYQYDYDKFISTHKERRKELEKLANNPYTATRESHLYNLDWKNICQSASLALVPSENWAYQNIKQKLGIPEDKKVILYAPTYRERGPISLPFNPARLLSHLNNEYVIITKLHYLNSLQREYKNVIDCTSTADLADLMKMADILISDYSSLVLDFAVLNKPIILFQYDSYDYMRQRGVYFDFEEYLPARQVIDREIDLYRLDWNSLDSDNNKLVQTFYPLEDGHSTKRIADVLALDADPRFGKDIIFLINDLNQIGGIHTFIKNMAKYYKEKYNSRIYVLAIKEFAENNSEYHVFQSPYIDFYMSSQYLRGGCASILQNTDGIVISLQFSAHLHFQKYLSGAKTVLMFHGDVKDIISQEMYGPHLGWLNEGNLYNYDKLLLLTDSAVQLLSPHLKEEVRNKLGFIHNSIEAEYQAIDSHCPNHTAVISRLDADKNIFALIELGKEIQTKNSNIVVNVYGDGKLKGEFQAAIDDNGLHDIIRLRGFEPDKGKIFTENDSLILLSKSEGFGLVLLEAYAHGKPVVVFDSYTGASEVVKHGKTGFLVPYDDYTGVIDTLGRLDTLDVNDIKDTFNEFSNETVFGKWDQLFSELDNLENR